MRLTSFGGTENPVATLNIAKLRLKFPVSKKPPSPTPRWLVMTFTPATVDDNVIAHFNSQTSFLNGGHAEFKNTMTHPKLEAMALDHEQLHLDIGELVARTMKAEFKSYAAIVQIDGAKKDGEALASNRARSLLLAFAQGRQLKFVMNSQMVHNRYDQGAGGLANPRSQTIWDDKVRALLAKKATADPNDISPWQLK